MRIEEAFQRTNNLRDMPFPFEVRKANVSVDPMPVFHWHAFWELSLVTRGEGLYEIENNIFPVKQGDLILINPTQRHRLYFASGTHLYETVVHFDPRLLQAAGTGYAGIGKSRLLHNIPFPCGQNPCLEDFEQMCAAYAAREDNYEWAVLSHLFAIFSRLIHSGVVKSESPAESKKRQRTVARLNDIITYIHQEAFGDIRMREVSAKFYMNETYFSEFFKAHMGINFREYLTRLRIDEAIRLYSESNHSATEIAHETGFGTTTGFYHAFKRVTGQSPSEYFAKKPRR